MAHANSTNRVVTARSSSLFPPGCQFFFDRLQLVSQRSDAAHREDLRVADAVVELFESAERCRVEHEGASGSGIAGPRIYHLRPDLNIRNVGSLKSFFERRS